jgi:hypothetical protein
MSYTQRTGIKSVRNSIIITEDGERIDIRKVDIGKIRHQQRNGGNKYGARTAEYQGVTYHSTMEAQYAAQLELQKRGKLIKDWERQIKIPLIVYGKLISTYYADFRVTHNDGTIEIIEVKGMLTEYARIKWNLFTTIYTKEHPEIKITMVRSAQIRM